jgi:DNA-binding NarL/FixJ family response regulator
MAHVLVYASDPAERHMAADIVAEEGVYDRVTVAATEAEALDVMCSASHPLVVVLPVHGSGAMDTATTHILTAARDASGTWPAARSFVLWGWTVSPQVAEIAAALQTFHPEHLRPEDLLEAVRAAAAEMRAESGGNGASM